MFFISVNINREEGRIFHVAVLLKTDDFFNFSSKTEFNNSIFDNLMMENEESKIDVK